MNPTARRDLYLPDASGVLALAGTPTTRIDCGQVQLDPPALPSEGTLAVTIVAPAVRERSACVCSAGAGLHDDVSVKNCGSLVDGELKISLYNAIRQVVPDADTPSLEINYCCIKP